MDSYTSFAEVYDEFMDNIPYEEWASYIIKLLQSHNIYDGLMLDLGCGTGTLTRILSKKGFDMIGIDNSTDMLEIARSKQENPDNILYLLQDMREFELYGTVKSIISVCDSINYITDPNDLLTVFKLVNNYLDPKGLFIFDFNSVHHYQDILADNTFAEDRQDNSFIWDNYFDEESCINEYMLSLFIKQEDGLYKKYIEEHYQRGYSVSEITSLISKSGLKLVSVFDAFTENEPTEESTRIYVIARENGK